MANIPDLVDHFRLETHFLPDHTLHVISTSNTGYGRRKVRVEKRWARGKRIGRGTFGDVWLETGTDGDKRAVKAIEKQITSRYKIDYMKELLAMAKLSKVRHDGMVNNATGLIFCVARRIVCPFPGLVRERGNSIPGDGVL
jgi:hypothetical protein